MPDYAKSKIYKLVAADKFYIGSTTGYLCSRKAVHKAHSKLFPERKVYKTINEIGWDNIQIELIEQFECETNAELVARETFYIDQELNNSNCLNMKRSYQTDEERKEKMKIYRETDTGRQSIQDGRKKWHKENGKAYLSAIVQCDCGVEIQRCSLSKHRKSSRHNTAMNSDR